MIHGENKVLDTLNVLQVNVLGQIEQNKKFFMGLSYGSPITM